MNANHLNGTERDAHDTSYVAGIHAVIDTEGVSLVERGRLLRENILTHFPEMKKVFAMLPELV